MKKFVDRTITGFFVLVFGILWFCSSQYYVKSKSYQVVIYDVYGKELNQNQIRTQFSNLEVARSFIKEYQDRFPHLDFSIKQEFPEIRKQMIFKKILKRNHK